MNFIKWKRRFLLFKDLIWHVKKFTKKKSHILLLRTFQKANVLKEKIRGPSKKFSTIKTEKTSIDSSRGIQD